MDRLDLDVPEGGVFGFLGPNGAGKTTTIRCLLGLVAPTSGAVTVLGADIRSDLATVIDHIGALVETPKFFPTFSGRDNLRLLAAVRAIPDREVDRTLEEVGLDTRGDDLFHTYSLGMKQRLAVASTLLKSPKLLILDEPANGLDPAGIKEMRDLVRHYGSSGSTVFVSSHQLAEIQLMCDSVAIINRGKLVASGSVKEVLASRGGRLLVTIDRQEEAVGVLSSAGFEARKGEHGGEVIVDVDPTRGSDVTRALAGAGLYLSELRAETASLESVFLELTSGHPDGAP